MFDRTWACNRFLLMAIGVATLASAVQAQAPAEPQTAYVTLRTIASPSAHQAAAADAEHFYAISSSVVAKISRKTGATIAHSSGAAKHLNSGFLHEGQLYLAHSKFPLLPEQSQVKLLDTESMQLTTLVDLSQHAGSLTWVVRRNGTWWCNFAFYGADNVKTYLLQLDDKWQVIARWNYPKSLVDRLGRYSLSGGLWLDDELLVIGHDDPLVFRLRLPKQGRALKWVGEIAVPFTGQGIAVDSVSGGLIGISRARHEIILARREQAEPSKP